MLVQVNLRPEEVVDDTLDRHLGGQSLLGLGQLKPEIKQHGCQNQLWRTCLVEKIKAEDQISLQGLGQRQCRFFFGHFDTTRVSTSEYARMCRSPE